MRRRGDVWKLAMGCVRPPRRCTNRPCLSLCAKARNGQAGMPVLHRQRPTKWTAWKGRPTPPTADEMDRLESPSYTANGRRIGQAGKPVLHRQRPTKWTGWKARPTPPTADEMDRLESPSYTANCRRNGQPGKPVLHRQRPTKWTGWKGRPTPTAISRFGPRAPSRRPHRAFCLRNRAAGRNTRSSCERRSGSRESPPHPP